MDGGIWMRYGMVYRGDDNRNRTRWQRLKGYVPKYG